MSKAILRRAATEDGIDFHWSEAVTKLLTELREYIERLKHRADVRGGPDVSAMGIADEAIALIDAALAQPQYVSSECRMVPWCPKPAKNESCIRCGRLYERPQDSKGEE